MTATVTRRAMLAGAATSLATLATASPGAQPAPTMAELIDAHRRAAQVYAEANARRDTIVASLEGQSCLVPIVLFEDGGAREWMEFGGRTPSQFREIIARRHSELLNLHCSPTARRLSPATADAMNAAIYAAHHRANESLERIAAERAAQWEAAGLPDALDAIDAASEVARAALAAIILRRPGNAEERSQRHDYLAELEDAIFADAISIVAEIIETLGTAETAHA